MVKKIAPPSEAKAAAKALNDSAPAQRLHAHSTGSLWAFAEEDTTALRSAPVIAVPDYYETELEGAVRAQIIAFLAERGATVVADPADAQFVLTYGAEVDEPTPRRAAGSPLRIAPSRYDETRRDERRLNFDPDDTPRPTLSLGPRSNSTPGEPAVTVTIIVSQDDRRVWSALAENPVAADGRRGAAVAAVAAMLAHWGEDAAADAAITGA